MKKVLTVFALVALIGFTSCAKKRYTCPTYMKDTRQQKDIKVKHTPNPHHEQNDKATLVKARS